MNENQIFDLIIFKNGKHSEFKRVNTTIALKLISDSLLTPDKHKPVYAVKVTFVP